MDHQPRISPPLAVDIYPHEKAAFVVEIILNRLLKRSLIWFDCFSVYPLTAFLPQGAG